MSRFPTVLAGDIGGTKILLGLFEAAPGRPQPLAVREYSTLDYPDLTSVVATFLGDAQAAGSPPAGGAFGVAGPVMANAATLTNVPRHIDGGTMALAFGIPRVDVINDLMAMAYGAPALVADELVVLQAGNPHLGGNMALVAAGTGLGEALLLNFDGQYVPSPTEGGHADFPARTEREIALLRDLTQRFGRAAVEHVLSGNGLVNISRTTHKGPCLASRSDADPVPDGKLGSDGGLTPARISRGALDRTCPDCVEALEMFVEAYGAEAGNLALRTLATGGIFVGGGIAPKILPALANGVFVRAFVEKAPFDALLRDIPVHVILNAQVGLLGAAVYAARQI